MQTFPTDEQLTVELKDALDYDTIDSIFRGKGSEPVRGLIKVSI